MSGPIRNWCFARGSVTGAQTQVVYEVPADTVLLLKSAHLLNQSAVANALTLGAYTDAPTSIAVIASLQLNAWSFTEWNGWVAVNSGDLVQLTTGADLTYYWLSGALLPFIPGQLGAAATAGEIPDLAGQPVIWQPLYDPNIALGKT